MTLLLIFVELFFLFIVGKLLDICLNKDVLKRDYKYITLLTTFIDINNIFLIIDPLNYTWSVQLGVFFESNGTLWNKILGNSLSLNILYEFILYVNKETKGYYFYEYNMMTRLKIKKKYFDSNIPWDILPRTRYVIMSLRYVQTNKAIQYNLKLTDGKSVVSSKVLMDDYRMKVKKNMYLTLFEKTYGNVSILVLIFLLRLNLEFRYMSFRSIYYSELLNDDKLIEFEKTITKTYLAKKVVIIKLYLAKISKENPKLLNAAYFLHTFDINSRMHDMEGHFMLGFLHSYSSDIISKLPKLVDDFYSLQQYKAGFEILSKLLMFEEEAIVWNNDMVNFFYKLELLKSDKLLKQKYLKTINDFLLLLQEQNSNLRFQQQWLNHEIIVSQIFEFFGVKFEGNLILDELLYVDLNILLSCKIIIIDIELGHEYDDLLEFYYESLEMLENLKLDGL
jgi:hypothetical protein